MERDVEVIWVKRERKYFCEGDWTGSISLIQFNKSNAQDQLAPWDRANGHPMTGLRAIRDRTTIRDRKRWRSDADQLCVLAPSFYPKMLQTEWP